MKIISEDDFHKYYRIAREGVEKGEPAPDIRKVQLNGRLVLSQVWSSAFLDHLMSPEAKGFHYGQRTVSEASAEILQNAQAMSPRYVVSPRFWAKQEADVIVWAVWTYVCEPTGDAGDAERLEVEPPRIRKGEAPS